MGSGFKVNNVTVSKSEARNVSTGDGTSNTKANMTTKKYLEQITKNQKKRTESTAQQRFADMM